MIASLLLLAIAAGHPGASGCDDWLVARGYEPAAAAQSRAYTDCVTEPALPTERDLATRLEQCARIRDGAVARAKAALLREPRYRNRSRAAARAAAAPFRWVDHIASNFPGCATNLTIAGDGSELPNVTD
jgi:hypothetical protein